VGSHRTTIHLEGVKFRYEGEKERRVVARFRLERRESLQKLERESRGKILSKVALVCVALLLNVIVAHYLITIGKRLIS
jgi:hypothetical protein